MASKKPTVLRLIQKRLKRSRFLVDTNNAVVRHILASANLTKAQIHKAKRLKAQWPAISTPCCKMLAVVGKRAVVPSFPNPAPSCSHDLRELSNSILRKLG